MPIVNSSLNFEDIKERLKLFMSSQDEFSDYDFEASGMSAILNLLAKNTELNAYMANAAVGDTFMSVTNSREVASSLSSFLGGYVPQSKRGARTTVDIVVTPSILAEAPSSISLNKETVAFVGNKDDVIYQFSPAQSYVAPLANGVYTFVGIELVQGSYETYNWLVQGNGIDTYVIPHDDIDIDTLTVEVQESSVNESKSAFARFDDLFNIEPSSKIFHIEENRRGLYQIEFGDGIVSYRLVDGNIITARYIRTNGGSANEIQVIKPASLIEGYSNIAVSNVQKTYGGSDKESLESIRRNAPLLFASAGSAVSDQDYDAIVKAKFSEADDVIAWSGSTEVPPKHGYTYIAVKPNNGDTLTQAAKNELVNDILAPRNVGSITPIIVDPSYIDLNLDVTIKYLKTLTVLDESELRKQTQDHLNNYSDNNLEKFGQSYEASLLAEYINNLQTSFVSNVVSVSISKTINDITPNTINSSNIRFNNAIKAGSVSMTGFSLSVDDRVYELYDENGDIKIRSALGNQITEHGVYGSVDYNTGLISIVNLNPVSIGTIVINATPSNADINSVRESILRFNNINVNFIVKES